MASRSEAAIIWLPGASALSPAIHLPLRREDDRMKRFPATVPTLLVGLLTFASAATSQPAPKAAATQPVPKSARIGLLCAPTCDTIYNKAFFDELSKLGWVEGSNLVVERKDPDNRLDQLPAFAAELVQSKPDIIVAVAAQAARAAKNATSDIPIVMLYVGDPVGLGFAASLAHPGGNMTGVTALVPGDFIGKMLGILREALPQVKRLAIVMNPLNPNHQRLYPETLTPAIMLGFQLDRFEVREADGVPAAVAAAKAEGAEALYIFADVLFSYPPNRVPDLAAQAGLPSMGLEPSFARAGGLMAYGPDFLALTRRAAHYVDKIAKGAKASELPIEQPTKFLTVINLKTAKSLGLEIPPTLIADEVIE
jgi:putative tryptophan/tyrosine transport system substrate-binding protein